MQWMTRQANCIFRGRGRSRRVEAFSPATTYRATLFYTSRLTSNKNAPISSHFHILLVLCLPSYALELFSLRIILFVEYGLEARGAVFSIWQQRGRIWTASRGRPMNSSAVPNYSNSLSLHSATTTTTTTTASTQLCSAETQTASEAPVASMDPYIYTQIRQF